MLRSSKTVGATTTRYIWAGGLLMAQMDGTNTIAWSYDAGGHMLGFTLNGTPYFYIRNLQGDVVGIYDATGAVVAKYEYDAWGNLLDNPGNPLYNSSVAKLNPIRYRGYYWDSETNLYYLQSRYYSPELCRFISSDVYLDTGDGILGTNMYAYCQNDCVNYGDPSGTDAIVLFMQKFPGGGGVFGDIGLIVQKGSDWSFFLWSSGGPIMIPLDAKDGKLVSTTFEELNQELYDKGMRIAGLSDWASAMFGSGSSSQSSKTGGRKSGYKSSVYLSGDYTATFAFCKDAYENGLEKTYSFLFNNCSQVALEALGQSNSTIDSKYGKLISTIPLVIYNFLVKYGTKNVLVK